jgi:hypothetical protein
VLGCWAACSASVLRGYTVSGQIVVKRITVKLNDRTQKPSRSYPIPPGLDVWVEGNECFVCIEAMSAGSRNRYREHAD